MTTTKSKNNIIILPQNPTWTQNVIFLILMLIANAMVWRYFVKGLHSHDGSTLVTTAISTASNFISSGVLSMIIFDEATNYVKVMGIGVSLIGLYFIMSEDEKSKKSE